MFSRGIIGVLSWSPSLSPAFHASIALVVISCLYRQVLVYDTLAQQNIIQTGGLSVLYGMDCIFNGMEYSTSDFTRAVTQANAKPDNNPSIESRTMLARKLCLALVIVMPCWTVFSVFLVWRLQREMAWKTFRKMDADLVMQHKYRTFQVSFIQWCRYVRFLYWANWMLFQSIILGPGGFPQVRRLLCPRVLRSDHHGDSKLGRAPHLEYF